MAWSRIPAFCGHEVIKKRDLSFRKIPSDYHTPERIRTSDTWLRRPVLYPLSYGRISSRYAGCVSGCTAKGIVSHDRVLSNRNIWCRGPGIP